MSRTAQNNHQIMHFTCPACPTCSDSVEEGEKLVQTALQNFGRIGECVVVTFAILFQVCHFRNDCQCINKN